MRAAPWKARKRQCGCITRATPPSKKKETRVPRPCCVRQSSCWSRKSRSCGAKTHAGSMLKTSRGGTRSNRPGMRHPTRLRITTYRRITIVEVNLSVSIHLVGYIYGGTRFPAQAHVQFLNAIHIYFEGVFHFGVAILVAIILAVDGKAGKPA